MLPVNHKRLDIKYPPLTPLDLDFDLVAREGWSKHNDIERGEFTPVQFNRFGANILKICIALITRLLTRVINKTLYVAWLRNLYIALVIAIVVLRISPHSPVNRYKHDLLMVSILMLVITVVDFLLTFKFFHRFRFLLNVKSMIMSTVIAYYAKLNVSNIDDLIDRLATNSTQNPSLGAG